MKAVWNGQVLAESDETIVIEGSHYFSSEQTSVCPWKGLAGDIASNDSYFVKNVGGASRTSPSTVTVIFSW